MTEDERLQALAGMCGILPEFHDMQGHRRVTSPETCRALLEAMDLAAETDVDVRETLARLTARAGERQFPEEVIVESAKPALLQFGNGTAWTLRADDGDVETASGIAAEGISLPPLRSGVYDLTVEIGGHCEVLRVLAAPPRLASVAPQGAKGRLWGLTLALYGLRSARNCGLGDYEDLAQVAATAGASGAAFVGVNPIHNMGYADVSISPYSPSHRGFLNTTHIAADAIPGLEHSAAAKSVLARHATESAACRASDEVMYRPHKIMLHHRLEDLYAVFMAEAAAPVQAEFQYFTQTAGAELERFAAYETLSETLGPDWRLWPDGKQPQTDPARRRFHMWLQWVADKQLHAIGDRAKGLSLGLYLDLAVGPRRGGAESWCEQPCIAKCVSIGAPPDHLSPEGQNWNLAAFAPRKLAARNYRPMRRILAQIMRHAGVVRIDHVLGLMRSFLIPDTGAPGAYVSQPMASLIAIIKIEAERNGCAVIGEDLGLVPANFREEMRRHGFYGYSVLQYEKTSHGAFRHPRDGSAQVLSCFATHDTPTIRGYETGSDIGWWQRLGWIDTDRAGATREARDRDVTALKGMAGPAPDFTSAVHALLAASPARLVSVQLDDVLGLVEAQNLPGTIDEHPNWRRKYPVSVDDVGLSDDLKRLGHTMADAGQTEGETIP